MSPKKKPDQSVSPEPAPKPVPPEEPAPHPEEPAPHKEYDIDIYRAWCKQCGLCAAFCPRGVIELDDTGAPVIAHPERCTGCGWCELHCPDFAISVRERLKEASTEEEH